MVNSYNEKVSVQQFDTIKEKKRRVIYKAILEPKSLNKAPTKINEQLKLKRANALKIKDIILGNDNICRNKQTGDDLFSKGSKANSDSLHGFSAANKLYNSKHDSTQKSHNHEYLESQNNKKYFQAPFENLREYCKNESSLVKLSSAIIIQAMIDSTAFGNGKGTKKIRSDARNWILGNSCHFKEVCMDANLSPEFVIKITKQLIM